jgi:hypothetical protein
MEPKSEEMREGLLSRLPQPANLAGYRREVADLIGKKEKTLRLEKRIAGATWAAVVVLSVALFWGAGSHDAAWRGAFACFWMIFGAVELLKYFINRAHVEALRETKQVQLQILELQALIRAREAR